MMWHWMLVMVLLLFVAVALNAAQKTQKPEEIFARMVQANRIWLTLPSDGLNLSYTLKMRQPEDVEPSYVAKVHFKAPDKVRCQTKQGLLIAKGNVGWDIREQSIERFNFSPRQLNAFRQGFTFHPPSRAIAANPKAFSFRLLGEKEVDGRKAWVLEVTGETIGSEIGIGLYGPWYGYASFGGDTVRLFVDCETCALLEEAIYVQERLIGVMRYREHRKFADSFIPMLIEWEMPTGEEKPWRLRFEMQIVGKQFWLLKKAMDETFGPTAVIEDVSIEPLDDKLFEPPPKAEKVKPQKFERTQEVEGRQEPAKTLKGKHLIVQYPAALEAYAKALLQIGDAAWEAYRELYNLPLPEPITLQIRLVPDRGERFAQLWTDGQGFIFLEVGSEKPLLSPEKGGAHNVYGICHELGHIALYHRMREVAGLPEGIAEGWPHYFGSVVTSYLFEKLGAQVYPDPHNYHETSGMVQLLRQMEKSQDPLTLAAKVLHEIEHKYGRQKLGEALNRTLEQRPSGRELVAKFVEALVAVTNYPQAKSLVSEQFLKPKVRIQTEFPDIAQKRLYYGLKLEWREGVLQLRYDDGEKDGQWSSAESGHGVIFCKPEGKWQLVAVEFYGARYGTYEPPDEDFSIFLCDANFNVIREFKAPYSLFAQRGEWKWERISVEPTEVPDFFYIVIACNSTATKGIYMAYDADVPKSHSRRAYPGSHLLDTEKVYDWMIRCYLKPADKATAGKAKELVKRLQGELDALKE